MNETDAGKTVFHGSVWRKIENAVFPLAAIVIGVGYSAAILVSNPLDRVWHSPHALILLVILACEMVMPLKFFPFPLRSGH